MCIYCSPYQIIECFGISELPGTLCWCLHSMCSALELNLSSGVLSHSPLRLSQLVWVVCNWATFTLCLVGIMTRWLNFDEDLFPCHIDFQDTVTTMTIHYRRFCWITLRRYMMILDLKISIIVLKWAGLCRAYVGYLDHWYDGSHYVWTICQYSNWNISTNTITKWVILSWPLLKKEKRKEEEEERDHCCIAFSRVSSAFNRKARIRFVPLAWF